MAKFGSVRAVITMGALDFVIEHEIDVQVLLDRHFSGDWGNLDVADKIANTEALRTGARLLSAYRFGDGKLWIITDAVGNNGKREVTTVLMPDDY